MTATILPNVNVLIMEAVDGFVTQQLHGVEPSIVERLMHDDPVLTDDLTKKVRDQVTISALADLHPRAVEEGANRALQCYETDKDQGSNGYPALRVLNQFIYYAIQFEVIRALNQWEGCIRDAIGLGLRTAKLQDHDYQTELYPHGSEAPYPYIVHSDLVWSYRMGQNMVIIVKQVSPDTSGEDESAPRIDVVITVSNCL